MDMDIEVNQPHNHNSGSSSKRFALKNAIQTNFGDDYVFQIVAKYVNLNIIISNLNYNNAIECEFG